MTPRLYTGLWVKAHIRTCFAKNIPAFVVARGDNERGGILLKINRFKDGITFLQPITSMEGDRLWMQVSGGKALAEAAANDLVAKRRASDPDLWVLEIEDHDGSYDLGEPIQA